MALAAMVTAVLHQLLPVDFRLQPHGIYPAVMGIFLVLLIAGDPGLIDRERRWLRVVTGLMITLIALSNLFSAIRLVTGIFHDDRFATDPYQLLAIGATVWVTNVLAFSLWYWDVDGGGAARRAARGAWADPAFVFPEMTMPDRIPATWYPQFVDYLALGFNTATAFSPTDVVAIKRWAKLSMIVESITSLVLATLVLAKAIGSI